MYVQHMNLILIADRVEKWIWLVVSNPTAQKTISYLKGRS